MNDAPTKTEDDMVLRISPSVVRAAVLALPFGAASCAWAWLQSNRYKQGVMHAVDPMSWILSAGAPWMVASVVIYVFYVRGRPRVWPRGARVFAAVSVAAVAGLIAASTVVKVHDFLWGFASSG